MMKYYLSINRIKSGIDSAIFNEVIVRHRLWAKERLAAGVLVQAGKWGDIGGMIIVRAASRDEADRVVKEGPLVQAGIVTFETAELHAARPMALTSLDKPSPN